MQEEQYCKDIEKMISLCLLRLLLDKKVINQPTYDKVVKIYKMKEAA